VLVRVTAAGVTPLDHTILSGGHPRAKAPLVLDEGAGVIEDAGESGLAVGSRVMFTGPYGVAENGARQDWLLVRPEHLALVPDAIDDVVAASLPVAGNQEKTGENGSVHCGLEKVLSARYCMCWPPLIAILAPVTNAASSEHR